MKQQTVTHETTFGPTEPFELPLALTYESTFDPGYAATWTDPGEGPDAHVTLRSVHYRRADGSLIPIELPAEAIEDIEKELASWILEANG